MKEFLVTYKYISKMYREKFRTFSFMYDESLTEEGGEYVPLSVQMINAVYRDLADTYDVDRTDGMSVAIMKIWRIDEGDVYAS